MGWDWQIVAEVDAVKKVQVTLEVFLLLVLEGWLLSRLRLSFLYFCLLSSSFFASSSLIIIFDKFLDPLMLSTGRSFNNHLSWGNFFERSTQIIACFLTFRWFWLLRIGFTKQCFLRIIISFEAATKVTIRSPNRRVSPFVNFAAWFVDRRLVINWKLMVMMMRD